MRKRTSGGSSTNMALSMQPIERTSSPRMWSAAGLLQIANVVAFIVCVACNAASGNKNKLVSDARPTAFTPAGYAFAIWGVIYLFATLFVIYQARPSKRSWIVSVQGWLFTLNFAANALWIFAFTQQWGDLWVSVAIIFVGILAPLLLLHRRLHIGGNGLRAGGKAAAAAAALPQSGSAGAASNVSSASSAAIAGPTFGEFFTTHVFVSLYAGWVSVACIANVALAGTPVSGPPSNWGWSASNWSITMQVVASALALLMIALYRDCVYAAPIAWALFAIAKQQRDDAWPGSLAVISSATALGAIVAVAAAATFCWRVYRWLRGDAAFAPSVVHLPGAVKPLSIPLLGWTASAPAGASSGGAVGSDVYAATPDFGYRPMSVPAQAAPVGAPASY